MPTVQLKKVSQPQRERLAYIEFRLLFLGCLNRSHLVQRFGLKESAASRDLALYRELASANITYDTISRTYRIGASFSPLFSYNPAQVLTALSEGYGDDFVATTPAILPVSLPSRLNAPSIDVLAPISRALSNDRPLQIAYRSLSSGFSKSKAIPTTLVHSGLRWHLRAFDKERQQYADFVLNRIVRAQEARTEVDVDQLKLSDQAWQTQIDLELVPHPELKHPETVAFEYGMVDDVLRVSVRAALAGYLLRHWNIDCTPEHSLKGPEYHLWLRNAETLYQAANDNLANLTIAPGFIEVQADRPEYQYQ